MSNRHVYVLAALLVAAGLGLFLYKTVRLDFPLSPEVASNAWEVEVKVEFETHGNPVRAELRVPASRGPLPILNEYFVSRGFGLTTTRTENQRLAIWSRSRPEGLQTLYYRALVEMRPTADQAGPGRAPELEKPDLKGADLVAAGAILDEAQQKSADLDTLVAQLAQRFENRSAQDQNIALLLDRHSSARERVERIVEILGLADYPARSMHGIHLAQVGRGSAELSHWLEVWDRDRWRAYDGATGATGDMGDYLIFWRGPGQLVHVDGGDRLSWTMTTEPVQMGGLTAAASRERLFSPDLWAYSLSNLPLATQNVYRVLLLIPVGAFVILVMRNIVGFKTFGTFMPVLIALAFRETHLLAGIILFSVLITLGLSIRFYLDRLKLLLVPRLAAVLIVVILLMLTVSVISHRLGIESGLSVALFPMVILTMTIERMSVVWEERGPREAVQEGVGSLFTATLAFAAMSSTQLNHLITTFPELLLVLLAATLLLGRYSGYRLLELRRFKVLAGGAG
ncbi:MAG: inactive transglutaminase family protein [Gammaproteobacteria bacterium]|nr:inactive transglutaminase family protein [Gammaproteobacteria bacterium]